MSTSSQHESPGNEIDIRRRESNSAAPSQAVDKGPDSQLNTFLSGTTRGPDNARTTRLLKETSLSHPANGGLRASALRRTQQTHGNHFVQRMVSNSQRKPQASRFIQRICACGGTCSKCEATATQVPSVTPLVLPKSTGILQAQAADASRPAENEREERELTPEHSEGQALDERTRHFMGSRFGRDFRDVRVHADEQSDASARAINADAFTTGRDMYFAAGKYAPSTQEGQHLLAHELTHTIQQGRETPTGETELQGHTSFAIGRPDDPLEREADNVASEVMSRIDGPGGQLPDQDQMHKSQSVSRPAMGPRAGVSVSSNIISRSVILRQPQPPASMPPPLASVVPSPAPPAVMHEGVKLIPNAKYLREQLENMVALKGEAAMDAWAYRFINMTVERKMQYQVQGIELNLIEDTRIYLKEEVLRLEYDNKEFIKQFEQKALDITRKILDHSEKKVKAEIEKYGITKDTRREEEKNLPGSGGPSSYLMSNKEAGKGLQGAASELAQKRKEVNKIANQYLTAKERVETAAKGNPFLIPADLILVSEKGKQEWVKQEEEYDKFRNDKVNTYPILAAYATGSNAAQRLEALAASGQGNLAQSLGELIEEKLANISMVRSELGGKYSIWKEPHIINIVKKEMNASDMQKRVISDKATEVKEAEESSKMLFAAVAIGLGLLAALPTGGGSFALAGIAATAAAVGAGMGMYSAYESIREYMLASAATGTDFDKANAISQDEPSMLWLALDVVAAVAEVHAAAAAFKTLRTVMQAAKASRLAKLPEVIEVSRRIGLSAEAQGRVVAAAVRGGGGPAEVRATLAGIEQTFKKLDPNIDRKLAEGFQRAADLLISQGKLKVLPSSLQLQRQAIRDMVGDWKIADKLFNELQGAGIQGLYVPKLNIVLLKEGGSDVRLASFLAHELGHQVQEVKIGLQNMSHYEQEFQAFVAEQSFLKLLPREEVPEDLIWLLDASLDQIDNEVLKHYPTAWVTKPRAFEHDAAVAQASADKILDLLKNR